MALIICPECGGKLSDKADFCPHCGYNQFKKEEVAKNVSEQEDNVYLNQYIGMTEEELNLLVKQYIVKVYPQLFENDTISQQKDYYCILENVFEALEKVNSENKFLLMKKKYAKIPYLHLALFISTYHYLAISKEYLEKVLDITLTDNYKEIGLHLEVMADDFGEVLVLEENYDKFVKFSPLYHKVRFKEKSLIKGDYIIYQYGSSVDSDQQLSHTHVSLHLGDCCLVEKELRKHIIEKKIWDKTSTTKKSEVSLAKRAVVGGIIAGPVGAMVGVASGIDKKSKSQENSDNTNNYHMEYTNDDSYVLSLTSKIVYGVKFFFVINRNRTNYIKFGNNVYEKMNDLYLELKKNMVSAQEYRQQMYAWVSCYGDINGFTENSDKALECLKSYNLTLYSKIMDKMKEKDEIKEREREKKKSQYLHNIEEKEKWIVVWQDKYNLYKNKKFGEGKKMKDYCYSQVIKFQEEKEALRVALAKLEDNKEK